MTDAVSPPEQNRGATATAAADAAAPGLTPEAIQFAHRMFNAARHGDPVLLEAIAAGLPTNLTNDEGNTLLMLAAYNGHAELARGLVARGADVNRTNDRGQTPLAGVVFKGFDEIAHALIDAGADPNAGTPTALQTAQMFNKTQLLALMQERVDQGAPPPPPATIEGNAAG